MSLVMDTCSSSSSLAESEEKTLTRESSSTPARIVLPDNIEAQENVVTDAEEVAASSPMNESSTARIQNAIVAAAEASSSELEERLVWVGDYVLDTMAKYRRGTKKP
jgi:hypothetical protein